MTYLLININTFGFVHREKCKGVSVKYKCGRDFLYYALNYYVPSEFNQHINNPEQIEKKRLFGFSVPATLAWTMLPFILMLGSIAVFPVIAERFWDKNKNKLNDIRPDLETLFLSEYQFKVFYSE